MDETAARLLGQALLGKVETGAAGQAPAQPVQTGLGNSEPARVSLHRPMLGKMLVDERAELPQALEVLTAMNFRGRRRQACLRYRP